MRSLLLSAFFVCVLVCVAHAFPPAPGVVVYGLVKDPQGRTVDGPDAYVIFNSGNVEIARAELEAGILPTENYRALLPSDMADRLDGYRDDVLDAALPFTVQVQIGWQVFDPIESSSGLETPEEPGSAIRFDFSLGTDSDADGLPDEWEYSLLERFGYAEGDDGYSLDRYSGTGDFDEDGMTDREEYLASTFAYLDVDTLDVQPVLVDGEGIFKISLLAVEGGIFEIVGSNDLKTWEGVEFWVEGDESLPNELVQSFLASDTRAITILIKAEDVARLSLFRVKVH